MYNPLPTGVTNHIDMGEEEPETGGQARQIAATAHPRLSKVILSIGCMFVLSVAFSAGMNYNNEPAECDLPPSDSSHSGLGSGEYSGYSPSGEPPSGPPDTDQQVLETKTFVSRRMIGHMCMGLLSISALTAVVLVLLFAPRATEQIVGDVEALDPPAPPHPLLQSAKAILQDDVTVAVGLGVMLVVVLALHLKPGGKETLPDQAVTNVYMSAAELHSRTVSNFIGATDGATKVLRMLQFMGRFLVDFFPTVSLGNLPHSLAEGRAALRLFNLPSTVLLGLSLKFKDMPLEGFKAVQVVALVVSSCLDNVLYFEAQSLFLLSDDTVSLMNVISGWVYFVYIVLEAALCLYQLVRLKRSGKRVRDDRAFMLKLFATVCDSVLALSRCVPGGFLLPAWVDVLGVTSSLIGILCKVGKVRKDLQPTKFNPE